jgi:hypothetical protein
MWYIGAALGFIAGYLYHSSRSEAAALTVAAFVSSFLGEYLSAARRSSRYKVEAERAQVRMASLHVEAEEAKRNKEMAERRVEELKEEINRLRGMLPAGEEKKERIERIIAEVGEL